MGRPPHSPPPLSLSLTHTLPSRSPSDLCYPQFAFTGFSVFSAFSISTLALHSVFFPSLSLLISNSLWFEAAFSRSLPCFFNFFFLPGTRSPQQTLNPFSEFDRRRRKKEQRAEMTRQNVVVADAKSGINVAITMTVSNPSLFTKAVQKTREAQGGCITIPAKKIKGGARINAWLDSMRASSPTRLRTTTSLSDQSSWMLRHPSALNMFEEIIEASKGKQIVMFLDYDGTLSPIVDDPDRAFMSDAMRAAVRQLARYFPTAIVSGRCRDKVYNFVRLAELYYAGSHGMDIKGPAKGSKYKKETKAVLFQPASEFLPMIDEAYKALLEKTKSIPGASVEHNKFCLSVHFRCVDEKKWDMLAQQVRSVLQHYPKLRLTQGRKVLEIRPTIKWDKGKALEFLLESLGFGNCTDVFPVYIGDDRTDEDAFKILRDRGQGFGILVSKIPKDTSATYSLQEPLEVMYFLQRLVEWKRLSVRQYRV